MVVMVKPQQQGGVQQAFGWYTGRCRFEQNGSQRAHPKTRSQATRDRRYRSESGGRAGTQQFIGTMSLVHRRSLSLDISTLAKLYSHMEDDGASEPAKTPTGAGAGQRLGPKVNTDAINAGLRALDRPGAPCRRWGREILQLKSFTGVLGQLPSWRSPKPPKTDDNGEVMIIFSANEFPIELYNLCKDQHGCRYLQRKLEERLPEHIQMMFEETSVHVVELMTDPFGNYLCQKLLEYSNVEQCTALINSVAPQLVTIAPNQHGTRALQKMIERISAPEQTQTVIQALENHAVELVQGLNGNHVIQKCLNRWSAEDSQFVYNAVGTNRVVVHSEGRISTDPIRKTNGFRGSKELHLKQARQHRLILSNIRNLRFNGELSTNAGGRVDVDSPPKIYTTW